MMLLKYLHMFSVVLVITILPMEGRAAPLPFERQVAAKVELLQSDDPAVRAGAAEALGFLRAYAAADSLALALTDDAVEVRRESALALAWCGGRTQVAALIDALEDTDWVTRQAAWVSLTNLTGMEFPFDALAEPTVQQHQTEAWRIWWSGISDTALPEALFTMLDGAEAVANVALGCTVTASKTYKGPLTVLTDGRLHADSPAAGYWQTKNVAFPQQCTLDLGTVQPIGSVTVHQYGDDFCMTDYALELSVDGERYTEITRMQGRSPVMLPIPFTPQPARYIRIISYGAVNPTYPTTFREIEVYPAPAKDTAMLYAYERSLRALGALGGPGAAETIHPVLRSYLYRENVSTPEKSLVQAGIRSAGRLRHPDSYSLLVAFLENPQWARYAADALGEYGDPRAVLPLVAMYPRYARNLQRDKPKVFPEDDWPRLSSYDRMFETPYAIAYALARLPIEDEESREALRSIAPLLVVNLPSDYDAAMLYDLEASGVVTAHLLESAGMRRFTCNAAFRALGVDIPAITTPYPHQNAAILELAERLAQDGVYAIEEPYMEVTSWLPAFCRETEEIPALITLLEHDSGWARINAAKALMFMGAQEAVEPLLRILNASKPEGAYGYFGGVSTYETTQGQDEINDPAPRWREAYIRALGRLGAVEAVPLLETILNDERNAPGIQHAAALVLDELDTPDALRILEAVEQEHPFYSVQLVAREALWRRDRLQQEKVFAKPSSALLIHTNSETAAAPENLPEIVFIKGEQKMPNEFQIDPWRQTYSTTDTGPTYRLGRNLYRLNLGNPDAEPVPLTQFTDGYVADCEVAWEGDRILFARRGGDTDPWWHIWEMQVDGSGLRQITDGPYHDVQPAYLPDGRIVFSSSRIGMRDEYHGYLACGLSVMNADGSDIQCIGFNLGGDREPAVLEDGRIVFSRLELFYSRLKTELILEAAYPDGTKNVTLYGPERREFWRQATQIAGERWWGEAPPRHRVVRVTQPQPFGEGRVLCASTAGLTITGPGRYQETVIPHDKTMAVTSPYPLDTRRILCAATKKEFEPTGQANATNNDLALYLMDAEMGAMTLLYNDPETAEFEARPIMARPKPPVRPMLPRQNSYTGRFVCNSAFLSQEARVAERGKLVRVVEGQPVVTRHRSHTSRGGPAWKNHTGTHARVLGTVPLGADGSFHVEVPADRLVHVQILDSDRRVVGNQQIWMYARPGETRSCVGCHENPNTTPPPRNSGFAHTAQVDPVRCLPTGGEFSYRAKFWNKGTLTDEGEERTRTVRAVNLLGRY